MWEALKRALSELGWEKHEFAVVWGIGCHGNGADFLDVQGMHALHGRALPPATALRLTRPDLHVIVEMGDGDGYGLGMGHFVHALRRNPDITVIAHNNQIYGLTTGQASPTTDHLMRTVSTPGGVLEQPVNPIGLALAEDATFVARGFAGDIPHLTELYKQALDAQGLRARRRVPAVRDLEPAQHLPVVPRARLQARGDRLGHHGPVGVRSVDDDLPRSHLHARDCRVPIGVFYRDREHRPTRTASQRIRGAGMEACRATTRHLGTRRPRLG